MTPSVFPIGSRWVLGIAPRCRLPQWRIPLGLGANIGPRRRQRQKTFPPVVSQPPHCCFRPRGQNLSILVPNSSFHRVSSQKQETNTTHSDIQYTGFEAPPPKMRNPFAMAAKRGDEPDCIYGYRIYLLAFSATWVSYMTRMNTPLLFI